MMPSVVRCAWWTSVKTKPSNCSSLLVEKPYINQALIDYIHSQILLDIGYNVHDAQMQAVSKWAKVIYSNHPDVCLDMCTEKSLAAIATADLAAFHKAYVDIENTNIAVVDAIDAEKLQR